MTVVVLGLGCATAQARHHRAREAIPQNPVLVAIADGEAYWGRAPCAGETLSVASVALSIGISAEANASNMIAEPDFSYQPAAAATFTGCGILISHQQWPDWHQMDANFANLCVIVTHELGHLLGYGHTTDERSVMTPGETAYNVPPQCAREPRMPARWRTP